MANQNISMACKGQEPLTDLLLDSLLEQWNKTVPLKSKEEQDILLSPKKLLADVNNEAQKYFEIVSTATLH